MLCEYLNKNYIKKFIVFIGVIGIITLAFCGCGKKSKEPKAEQQSHEKEQKSEEIPKELTELEENIEKIIKSLEGPSVSTKEDEEKSGSESSQGQGKESEEDQSSKGGESQGEQKSQGEQQKNQEGQQNQSSQQKPQQKDPWKEITPVINDMHFKWNGYMPEAAKKGANKELIDNFSSALNNLTNTVTNKNKTDTLMAASNLYGYIPDFYSLYKTSTSPEIKRIRHYSRNAILNSMTGNWEQAGKDINKLKDSWSLFKNTVPNDNEEDSSKLDFSIYELEKVIKEKNQSLTDIKGRVTLSNIQSLEKALEEGKGGQGGQSGQNGQSRQGGER
ncbi:MAG TPA: hypothetical protein GXX36_10035 [Clostridiaceae bacterium]|nr:hypothetical protein [Clostridiaceae bacterium]